MEAFLEIGDLAVVVGDGEFDESCLQAFEDPEAVQLPPRTKRCWLRADPGQRFTVHYRWNGQRRTGNKRHAGLFCELHIDGLIVERAFLPLKTAPGERGAIQREWEIPGKFFRTNGGPAMQLPFRFGERAVGFGVEHTPEVGSIRVVLYWARQNHNVPNISPPLTEGLAQEIAEALRTPVEENKLRACVDLGDPEGTEVVENDLRVQRVDNLDYSFIFLYVHPDVLANPAPVQSGGPAL